MLAAPQAIPPLPVILPLPLGLTVSVAFPELPPVNEAVTVCELFIVTLQVVGVPVHAPPQPEKAHPGAAGSAVRRMSWDSGHGCCWGGQSPGTVE